MKNNDTKTVEEGKKLGVGTKAEGQYWGMGAKDQEKQIPLNFKYKR